MPQAVLHLLPTFEQPGHYSLAADQRRQTSAHCRVQPALRATLLQDPLELEWRGDTPEGMQAQGLPGEIALDEPRRGFADHYRIWGSQALNPCRHIWGFPHG